MEGTNFRRIQKLRRLVSRINGSKEKTEVECLIHKSIETAIWVYGSHEEGFSQWMKDQQLSEPVHVTKIQPSETSFSKTSSVQGCRIASSAASSWSCTSSDVFVLDPDFAQVLEDVLLKEPPNDLRALSSPGRYEIGHGERDNLSNADLIASIAQSLAMSIQTLNTWIKQSPSSDVASLPGEQRCLTFLRDLLRNAEHKLAQDSKEEAVDRLYSAIRSTLMLFRSVPEQNRNRLIIEQFIHSNKINTSHIQQFRQGIDLVCTTSIDTVESILATSGLLHCMGLLAIYCSGFHTQGPIMRRYVNAAQEFFLLELSFGASRPQSWYRLAQCYEVQRWYRPGTQLHITQAIRCYSQAITLSQQVDLTSEIKALSAVFYYDLGILISCLNVSVKIDWDLDQSNTRLMAMGLFRSAIEAHENHVECVSIIQCSQRILTASRSHFMLAVSAFRLIEASHDHKPTLQSEHSAVLGDAYSEFLALLEVSELCWDWAYRFDYFEELMSLFEWFEKSAWPDSKRIANQTIAVLLQQRQECDPHKRSRHNLQPPGDYYLDSLTMTTTEDQPSLDLVNHHTQEVHRGGAVVERSKQQPRVSDTVLRNDRSGNSNVAHKKTNRSNRSRKLLKPKTGTKLDANIHSNPRDISVTQIQSVAELDPEQVIALAISYEKQRKVTLSMKVGALHECGNSILTQKLVFQSLDTTAQGLCQ